MTDLYARPASDHRVLQLSRELDETPLPDAIVRAIRRLIDSGNMGHVAAGDIRNDVIAVRSVLNRLRNTVRRYEAKHADTA